MTVNDLLNAIPALQKLAAHEFPIKTLMRVQALMEVVDSELNIFYTARDELLAKLGHETEPGQWEIQKENVDLYNEQIAVLTSRETVAIPQVQIAEDETIRLSYADLCALRCMIQVQGSD